MSSPGTFKLFNTLSRQLEAFEPLKDRKVGLYACGPTVYDFTHLGHLRKYAMDDVLVRTLRFLGYQVKFVQNITDVGHLASDADEGEDKLEKGARKYNQSVWDVARRFEDYYFYSMDLIGNLRPDISSRATEHIKEQLAMVVELERQGFAYVIEGDGVYFDTSRFEGYGQLARLKVDQQQAGARVGENQAKRHPSDFALWKFERPGENRAMVWPSPWHERSFPGWHIECSAMAIHYLGEQFEIHTGGIDHIPVHHTNEIAQAEAATGKSPFVRFWVHHNFLQVEGEKMSKSLNNFLTIDDIIKAGIAPKALRLLFLGTHYRSEMNYTAEAAAGAQSAWQKLLASVREWLTKVGDDKVEPIALDEIESDSLSQSVLSHWESFGAAILEDLNTPQALAVMWAVRGDDELTPRERLRLVITFDQVFGFDLVGEAKQFAGQSDQELDASQLPDKIQILVSERQAARERKDWQLADQLRDQLEEAGYLVRDVHNGQQAVYLIK